MKRITAFLLTVVMLSASVFATSSQLNAVQELERLDVVRKPLEKYDENSNISRRDMFKMIYIVVNANFYGVEMRKLQIGTDKDKYITFFENMDECTGFFAFLKEDCKYFYEFEDVEYASEDYLLAFSLMYYSLLNGTMKDGKRYAEFDRALTYEEAIAALCYLFEPCITVFYGEGNDGLNVPDMILDFNDSYVTVAKNLGIIDSKFPAEKLTDEISAYEFMYLLHNAIQVKFDFQRSGWTLLEKPDHSYLTALEEVASRKSNIEFEAIVD